MMPIAPLMIEHRLIERMINVMRRELDAMDRTGKPRTEFIDQAVDFIRVYADRCHHGKEEDILFNLLAEKTLTDNHGKMMNDLIDEHVRARHMTSGLEAAKERYLLGEEGAFSDIRALMEDLVTFYPVHIEKEDRSFFVPCMKYFSEHEQDDILERFWEFDRILIHEKYRTVVERFESSIAPE